MQFCSYSTWFAPDNAIERTLPLLLSVLIGILMFMLLSDEKHIKKITKNLSIFAKSVITFLYVCIVILLPTYNEYQRRGINSDFGSCCYNINFDSIYALQSTYLFQILFKHRGVRCLEGEYEIKPDFTVEFEYH